jgi:hypothetical protein
MRLENEHLKLEIERLKLGASFNGGRGPAGTSSQPARIVCPSGTTVQTKTESRDGDEGVVFENCIDASGIKNGPYKTFFSTGEQRSEGTYEVGKLNGVVTKFNKNGKVRGKWDYLAGKLNLGVKDAKTNMKLIRLFQNYDSAQIDIEIRNDTPFFTYYWKVDVNAYSRSGALIGKIYTNMTDLAAGKSASKYLSFEHTKTTEIDRIELRQTDVVVEFNGEHLATQDQITLAVENQTSLKVEIFK